MHDEKTHFDREELKMPEKLQADMKRMFDLQTPIPPEIDRAIMDRAHQQLVLKRKKHHVLRWSVAAAVAAVVIFAFILDTPFIKSPTKQISSAFVASSADIDQNGRINILDAFQLARKIESTDRLYAQWDMNHDGLVNREDIDCVAMVAVSLGRGDL